MTKAQEKLQELMQEFDGNRLYVTICIKHAYREATLQGLESSRIKFWEDVINEVSEETIKRVNETIHNNTD